MAGTVDNNQHDEELDAFDAMLAGTYEEEPEEVVDEADEDTDLSGDDDTDDDTTDLDDGEDDDTSDDDYDDGEEHSPVEDDDSFEDDSDDIDDDEDADDDSDEEDDDTSDDDEDGEPVTDDDSDDTDSEDDDEKQSKDDTDTDGEGDGTEPENTDEVDYKAFYDQVTSEFVVNGKKVKGFNDPKKIIQAQQMAGGFSEKMAGFKKYRKFMAPLKERGMLEDPDKFNLAMNILDGNVDAIKAHLQSLEIAPDELLIDEDEEQPQYHIKDTTASDTSILLEDTIEAAKVAGVDQKLRTVLADEWDDASFQEFVENPQVRNDLLDHLKTGAYDVVQARIAQNKMVDITGSFSSMPAIEQYRAAVRELAAEQAQQPQVETPKKVVKKVSAEAKIKSAKDKIADERRKADYEAKAEREKRKLDQRRKRAASVSKKKGKAKPKKVFDPLEVEGEELDALMDALINGDRAF